MKKEEIRIGLRVRSLVDFSRVPKGTEGVIDQDYGTGIMVAWDLPDRPLPEGYSAYNGSKWTIEKGILRHSFNKEAELKYLEAVK